MDCSTAQIQDNHVNIEKEADVCRQANFQT